MDEIEEDFDSYPPPQKLDSFGGVIEVQWEEDAGVRMAHFFVDILDFKSCWLRHWNWPFRVKTFEELRPFQRAGTNPGVRPSHKYGKLTM